MSNTKLTVNIRGVENEKIRGISSSYIDENSKNFNSQTNFSLQAFDTDISIANGTIIAQTGELIDNTYTYNGYVFSRNGKEWFFNKYISTTYGELREEEPNSSRIVYLNNYYYRLTRRTTGESLEKSKDLVTWELSDRVFPYANLLDIAEGDNELLALAVSGGTATIYASSTGEQWSIKATATVDNNTNRIVYGNGNYYLFSDSMAGGGLYHSANGTSFSQVTQYSGIINITFSHLVGYQKAFIMQCDSKFYFFDNDITKSATQILSTSSAVGDAKYCVSEKGVLMILYGNYLYIYRYMPDVEDYVAVPINLPKYKYISFVYMKEVGYSENLCVGLRTTYEGQLAVYWVELADEGINILEIPTANDLSKSGSYAGLDKLQYGNINNNISNGLLLGPKSSESKNLNGNYDYYASVIVYGEAEIDKLLLSFSKNGVFPTKIRISGKEYSNDNKLFYLNLDYNKTQNILIEFLELNLPNERLHIGSICSIVNYYIGKNSGLNSISIDGIDNSLPNYGIISYSGNISIEDSSSTLLFLSKNNLLPDINILIYINNLLHFRFSVKNELSLDEKTKVINIDLIDNIENLQTLNTNRDIFFANITGLELFNNLIMLFGNPVTLSERVNKNLRDIKINKVIIPKNSWWNIWSEFCVGIKGKMLKDAYNNYVIRG